MTKHNENHSGLVLDSNGNVLKTAYEKDYQNNPTKNVLNYIYLKKINGKEVVYPWENNDAKSNMGEYKIESNSNRMEPSKTNISLIKFIEEKALSKYMPNANSAEKWLDHLQIKHIQDAEGILYSIHLSENLRKDIQKFEESEQLRIRDFSKDLKEEYGVQDKPWAEMAYQKAYEDGHSAGYDEIKNYFSEIVDFISKVEESTHVEFYKKKAKEAYHLIDAVLETLPKNKSWLNPDVELNMFQFKNRMEDVLGLKKDESVIKKDAKKKNLPSPKLK
jgi:flagellar biosynthesis/type III secretory pathway protein FliH